VRKESHVDAIRSIIHSMSLEGSTPKSKGKEQYTRAFTAYELRRYDLAEREVRSALVSNPNDADCHILLARTLIQLGRIEQARAAANAAVALNPKDSFALFTLSGYF
jgi:Flp pilus assembly protein TadD